MGAQMHIRIKLPGGTLRFKHRRYLRHRESAGMFPMWRIGEYYFIWRRN